MSITPSSALDALSTARMEKCQSMSREHNRYERRAGIRFGWLVKQLIDDGMKPSEIARAVDCDPALVTKWLKRVTGPTPAHDLPRIGITDQTIQGIHDGLRVNASYLFMSAKGYPKTVKLKDGTERPAGPGELDHKLFPVVANIEEAREKRDNAAVNRRLDVMEQKVDALAEAMKRLTEVFGPSKEPEREDETRRHRR